MKHFANLGRKSGNNPIKSCKINNCPWTNGPAPIPKIIVLDFSEISLAKFGGTTSLPFEAGDNKRVAVKIVDDRGIESLKVIDLED